MLKQMLQTLVPGILVITMTAVDLHGGERSPYGINTHAPYGSSLSTLYDEVQACGISWVRIDFNWFVVEPAQDSFSWGIFDAITAAAEARGLHVYATIGYTPAWATSGSEITGVPDNAADWYDVCYRAAQRYDGNHGQAKIEYWGMWNEANLDQFWAGTRQQYIDMILTNGADAVHAANPNGKVCGPEMAHLISGDKDWYDWLKDSIEQAGDKIDIVTHHVYGNSNNEVTNKLNADTAFGGNPDLWSVVTPSVREVLEYTGWSGPVWHTEVGWQSVEVGEATQASYYTGLLNDWFTGDPSRSWIDKVFFYELSDATPWPELSWGILGPDPSYPRKPAFHAYMDFITAYPPPLDPPTPASDPEPSHGATNVGLTVNLNWVAGDRAESHDVYFGTTSPGTFRGNQTETTYAPGTLEVDTTYFWRIDEVGAGGTTTGDVWQFTTGGLPGDFDRDGDVDQEDFGHFQACLSGTSVPHGPGCEDADFDSDTTVDQSDFVIFLGCVSGANVAADPECAS